MIKHTRTLGRIGAALLAAFAAAGCTEYIPASNPAPQILGVTVADANDNETATTGWCNVSFEQCAASDSDCSGYCSRATLATCLLASDCTGSCSSTTTWDCSVDADCPGFCVGDPTRGCTIDDDCAPGDTCDATTGQTCNTAVQACVGAHGACSSTASVSCLADSDCPGHCSIDPTTPCLNNDGCPATGDSCVLTPAQTCTLPGTCSTTTATACAVNSQCPAGETCDNATAPGGLQTCNYPGSGVPSDAYNWPYPVRQGPMWVYGYTGGTVTSPSSWTLPDPAVVAPPAPPEYALGVPSGPWPSPKNGPYLWARPRIIFNKLMNGAAIQVDPFTCVMPGHCSTTTTQACVMDVDCPATETCTLDQAPPLHVLAAPTAGGTPADVTNTFGICYDPSSPTTAWGAAVFLNPSSGRLRSATTYHIIGSILDKDNVPTTVDFTLITAP